MLPASLLYLSVDRNIEDHHARVAAVAACIAGTAQHPLQVGAWPPALRALHLHSASSSLQPHALPPSLLYLALDFFTQPLLPDVPPSSLVELHLDDSFNRPLPTSALPSSLRTLSVGGEFSHPLQAELLPEGLLFLCFRSSQLKYPECLLPPLLPGVLRSTLLGVDFSDRYRQPLPAGITPPSVRRVWLWRQYRDQRVDVVLPAHVERVWYPSDDESDDESEPKTAD